MRQYDVCVKLALDKKDKLKPPGPGVGMCIFLLSIFFVFFAFTCGIEAVPESYVALGFMIVFPVAFIGIIVMNIRNRIKLKGYKRSLIRGTLYLSVENDLFTFVSSRNERIVFRASTFLQGSRRHMYTSGILGTDEFRLLNKSVLVNYGNRDITCGILIYSLGDLFYRDMRSLGYGPTVTVSASTADD